MFCSNCGKELRESDKFCPECGSTVSLPKKHTHDHKDIRYVSSSQGNSTPNSRETNKQSFINQTQPNRKASALNGQAPQGKAKTLRLLGFILLMTITVGLFAITGASIIGWISGIVILATYWLLDRRLKSKGCLLAILLWVATALLLFTVLVFTTPDSKSHLKKKSNNQVKVKLTKVFETAINPSFDVTTVNYENYKIIIPAGTVEKNENLIISKVEGAPELMKGLDGLCPPFDVKLGELREFKKPIIIEIPYDKSKLGGLSPEDAFIAVYYGENTGMWKDVPYQVDTNNSLLRLQMYHLTTVGAYYSRW